MQKCGDCGKEFENEDGLRQHRADAHGAKKKPWPKYVAVLVVLLAAGAALWFFMQPGQATGRTEHIKGNPNAAVEIVEYSDFQCPACTIAFPIVKQFLETNGNSVKFVYKHFPLSQIHPYAQKAAEAAECAGEQGKFYEMHDIMFENNRFLTVENLKGYAAGLGLDTTKFNECLDSGRTAAAVQADLQEGVSRGVSATPTFFINGVKYEGVQPADVFLRAIGAAK